MSVKTTGAFGDGLHDDTQPIQQAIDQVARSGGVVLLPAGTFDISKPLVLPRTGFSPTRAVQIVGYGQFATILRGRSGFPAGRGMIEWARPAADSPNNRIVGQRIAHLTIDCPWGVDQVSAVKHIPFNKLDSVAACESEWVQIDVENVRVECTNAFNEVLFDFPNGFRLSNWRNVTADPWRGEPNAKVKYDTIVLRVGSAYAGGPSFPGEDSIGVGFSHLDMLCSMQTRGGWCRSFEGRAYGSTFENCIDNGGRYGTGAIAYHFINSSQLTLRNLACEGQGSCTMKLENCDQIDAAQISGGTPPGGAGPYQDSIVISNSRQVHLSGHLAVPGAMPFSKYNVRALVLDKDCRDCVIERFDVRVMFGGDVVKSLEPEVFIDPAAAGCKVSGSVVQAYGNVRRPYSLER